MSGLLSALDELALADVSGVPAAALGSEITELTSLRNRLDAEISRRVEAFDRQGFCAADGAPSTQSWLRGRARLAPSAASVEVSNARGLRDLPATAAAWQVGEISAEHVRAIVLLAKQTSVEATQDVESGLVDIARLADPLRFGTELAHWRDALRRDRKPRNGDESDAASPRELTLASSLDGMTSLRGWLTGEATEIVRAALDPLASPLPADERTAAQRRHDALVELCRRALGFDDVAPGRRTPPQLMALCEIESLLDGERAGMAECGYGTLLSTAATQRIACDSVVSRVLINPDGEILDLGRTTRTVSAAQWKALVVRDRGCVVPGCDRPPTWCDAHHLTWWTRGGPSDLDNLALVCGYHHSLVHEGGWQISRHRSGRWALTSPAGTELLGDPTTTGGLGHPIGRRGVLRSATDPPDRHCPD